MLRKFFTMVMVLVLSWTTVACGSAPTLKNSTSSDRPAMTQTRQIPSGRYPIQQATYDDADGTYTLMLLNTPPGIPSLYRSANLQLARLTDEQIAQGEKSALEVDGDKAALYLTEDFRIEYVHNVTETKPDPQTGGTQSVVVRQESSFWSPFAGALAGQALGNLLFAPRYYVPPVYQSGGLRGFGGYGSTYGQAVDRYQEKHNSPPPAVKNRQTLRTTGSLRRSPSSSVSGSKSSTKATKSSGSGFGTSRLKSSGSFSSPRPKSNSSFGSSRRAPTRSYSGGGFSRSRRR